MQPNQPSPQDQNQPDEPQPADNTTIQPWDNEPATTPEYEQPQSVVTPQPVTAPDYQQPVEPVQQPQPFAQSEPQSVAYPPVEQQHDTPAPVEPPQVVTTPPNQSYQPEPMQPVTPQQQPSDAVTPAATQPTPEAVPVAPYVPVAASAPAPATKSKKPLFIIGLIIAVALVSGLGVAALAWWTDKNDPQQRLYRAVENHMMTDKIKQVYNQTTTQKDQSMTLTGTSDFSDPGNPKSHVSYELAVKAEGDTVEMAGEAVFLGGDDYYGKVTQLPQVLASAGDLGLDIDQWYHVDNQSFAGRFAFDPTGARTIINTSTGEFPIGNFSQAFREEMMSHIKESSMYEIHSSETVTIDGQKMTHYDLSIDRQTVKELREKIYDAYDIDKKDQAESTIEASERMEIWVSHATDQIVKAQMERDAVSGEGNKDTMVISISYPTDVSVIAKPDNAKAFDL